MTKLASEAQVTKNGNVLRMLADVDFDKGGTKRSVVVGPNGTILGYTEETVPPSLKGKSQLAAGEKLSDAEFTEATVIAILNTGQRWIMRNAFTTNTPKWKGGKGEVEIEISSCSMPEEV
jgi:hypothetical protein